MRVLHEQRGLRREDGERLEGAVVEERDDVVVAEVDDAEDVALLHERARTSPSRASGSRPRRSPDHSASCSASATTSGRRVSTTRWMMESETRAIASSMVSRATLRAARTAQLAVLEQDEEALVGVGHLEERVEQLVEEPREVGRRRGAAPRSGRACRARGAAGPAAGAAAARRAAAGSKKSSVAPTRIRSPGPRRQVERRLPFTVMSGAVVGGRVVVLPVEVDVEGGARRGRGRRPRRRSRRPGPTLVIRFTSATSRSLPSGAFTIRVATGPPQNAHSSFTAPPGWPAVISVSMRGTKFRWASQTP